jgi:uncharacterized protein YlxW (UPF0749 family)
MNPFANRISGNSWVVSVSVLGIVLIVLLRLAWITPSTYGTRSRFLSNDQASRLEASLSDFPDETKKLQAEVANLNSKLTTLQNAMGDKTKESSVINEQLQEIKLFAGLTEVEGPGVSVTLRDARRSPNNDVAENDLAVHDVDVLKVVNELWNAGAEAVAVNNQRVTAGTAIRCVGSVILVDNVQVAPPIKISAIGDGQTMEGGLNLPLSVLDELRSVDPGMVEVTRVKHMILPPYAGATQRKIAKLHQTKK